MQFRGNEFRGNELAGTWQEGGGQTKKMAGSQQKLDVSSAADEWDKSRSRGLQANGVASVKGHVTCPPTNKFGSEGRR